MSGPEGAAVLRRTDAKAFFANERTFLHWMSMAIYIGSTSAALLGLAGHAHNNWGESVVTAAIVTRVLSLLTLATSIGIAIYAGYSFHQRGNMLAAKLDGPYSNKVLPAVVSVVLFSILSVVFVATLVQVVTGE